MATVREFFDLDARTVGASMSYHSEIAATDENGTLHPPILGKTHFQLDANARFLSFYLPPDVPVQPYALAIFNRPKTQLGYFSEIDEHLRFGDGPDFESDHLIFTKRIHLYVDADVPIDVQSAIVEAARSLGLIGSIRDRGYARKKTSEEKPLAFISHDSSDKDVLVRELAQELIRVGCPVWYDEYSLKIGDSLRASIEKGLKEAPKCVLILSPAFLSNQGWGKAEFDSIFTREMLERTNVILPVWHGVTVGEVYNYSPRLADKVGLDSRLGPSELAAKISSAIQAVK